MGDKAVYTCEVCTYWEATHAVEGFDYNKDPKYKNCQSCPRRIETQGETIKV